MNAAGVCLVSFQHPLCCVVNYAGSEMPNVGVRLVFVPDVSLSLLRAAGVFAGWLAQSVLYDCVCQGG